MNARHRRHRAIPDAGALDSTAVPAFKPAYLIHGDDHGRIGERRSRLRAMAEAESGTGGVELFEGDACTPEAIAGALGTMTFALGRRFVIADGVERWKDAEVAPVAAAMRGIDDAATTVAFFAREEGRDSVPPALHAAVEAAGGVVAAEKTVKAADLPRWLRERAQECGIELELPAARGLVAQVGDRQQRLQREVEKLAIEHGAGSKLGVEDVEEACASSSERRTWTLADAARGRRPPRPRRAPCSSCASRASGCPACCSGWSAACARRAHVADALAAGRPPAEIKRGLRMPPFAADRLIADVRERDAETFGGRSS